VSGRFCSECGALVTANGAAPPSSVGGTGTVPVAERRITSVLFGDLVGFTRLSESRDAEDVRELLSKYFETARNLIERFGGVAEKFIGDAVMAVWGVPTAHEDDPERAVRAALDLVDAVALFGDEIGLPGLAMRVGIITGEVAVTLGAAGQGMVAGDAVNTAARVQALAGPGEIWVDETTRAATAAAVAYDEVGTHELKGKSESVRLFAARTVVAAVGGARRVDGLEAPFAGRDREIRLAKELFHATLEENRPRLVAVFGPAGVGKSRFGWEFDKYIDGISQTVHWHRGRCLSYGEGAAFWAFAEIVRGRLGILEGDPSEIVVQRLVGGLEFHISDSDERSWLLPRMATLIGVGDAVSPGTSFVRDDLFAAWRTFFERIARSDDSAAAYLQIDDWQWADQGQLDFVNYLLETATAPIFILTLARSELTDRAPGFGTGRRATAIHLEPLPDAHMRTLVGGLVAGLPDEIRDALVERSEGIPLFAVETVRGLIDRDAVVPRDGRYVLNPEAVETLDVDNLDLPTTLHTLIAARLDALPTSERRLVQDASVIGQAFTTDELRALVGSLGEDVDVDVALASLVRKEIFAVESDPRSPERGQYRFVQALVRAVAYDTLARRDRKARHLAVVQHLADDPDAESIPSVLASHYLDAHAAAADDPDAADLAAKAVALLEQSAARARALGAPEEAGRHLATALTLTTTDFDKARLTEEKARAEMAVGDPSAAAVLAEEAQARYTAAGTELDAWRAHALWADAQIAAGNGQVVVEPLAAAYALLENRADAAPVAAQLALQCARGYYLSYGETETAMPWFDRAVQLAEALDDMPQLASTLASYAGAFVLVGRPRMGLGLMRVSLDLARELDDPTIRLKPLNNLVSFLATRDLRTAIPYAEEGLAVVRRLRDREWGISLGGSVMHVYWNSGQWDEALELHAELGEGLEPSSYLLIMKVYAGIIQAARGEPVEQLAAAPTLQGTRADVMVELFNAFLGAAEARAAADLARAAELTQQAAIRWATLTGIDDDFVTFWLTGIDDALAVGDVAGAEELLALVTGRPHGHIPPYIRCQLPRVRAVINAAAGQHESVERDFITAATALREFGAPYWLGRTLLEHAEWLTARGREIQAPALAAEAARIFEELHARPWFDRATAITSVPPVLVDDHT
jgi:class 3 adenylate cyclase/tetratricopeptide (TPR) repeat protein